ncbi:hypothetical protein [Alteromonas gracilis]|uniref:Uncharacterized protein n=1 Tax=Alteromonas gracilis TaxID=1479524 RepID=A0ABX5CRW3_9ALTE|nr:hypothetical protein [Alteromonas gracilis]MCP3889622.1 hypothetical protein [Desulfobulbaceae bacterium]PRO70135.1 hypothetical protein C6Y39_04550 [Alteromonas gracilis]
MDLVSISAAYNGLKVAKDIFAGFNNLKVETATLERINEAVKKVGEAQDAIFMLREELFRLQEENNSLKQQINDRDSWTTVIGQYQLVATAGGAVVFKSKEEPSHFACPSCAQSKEIHILQDSRVMAGTFTCTKCQASYPVKPREKMQPIKFQGW